MNIDRIAREMVDVEPSVDLEARIRARVRAARPAPTAAWWAWRVAAPLGATATVALALVIGVPETSGPEVVRSVAVPGAQNPEVISSQLPNVPASALRKAAAPLPRIPTARRSKVPASQLSREEIAWMERRLPALDPVTALRMDYLRVDSIQPEPLAITPLTMTPVGTDGAGSERRIER